MPELRVDDRAMPNASRYAQAKHLLADDRPSLTAGQTRKGPIDTGTLAPAAGLLNRYRHSEIAASCGLLGGQHEVEVDGSRSLRVGIDWGDASHHGLGPVVQQRFPAYLRPSTEVLIGYERIDAMAADQRFCLPGPRRALAVQRLVVAFPFRRV
jgi:hypothetical protein